MNKVLVAIVFATALCSNSFAAEIDDVANHTKYISEVDHITRENNSSCDFQKNNKKYKCGDSLKVFLHDGDIIAQYYPIGEESVSVLISPVGDIDNGMIGFNIKSFYVIENDVSGKGSCTYEVNKKIFSCEFDSQKNVYKVETKINNISIVK